MSGASNLLAHLTPLPIEVTAAGRDYLIPAMDAVEWVGLLSDQSMPMHDIFPGLAGIEAVEQVEQDLWDDLITGKEIDDLGFQVITAAGDRPWWVVLRVIHAATGAWDRVHVNTARGVSLAGWLDDVWSRIVTQIDPKKLTSFVNEIETAPKGYETDIDFDENERAFLAAMRAVAS